MQFIQNMMPFSTCYEFMFCEHNIKLPAVEMYL